MLLPVAFPSVHWAEAVVETVVVVRTARSSSARWVEADIVAVAEVAVAEVAVAEVAVAEVALLTGESLFVRWA